MRELHDGIELLEDERKGGPFVWKNWDKWVSRCEQVASWLDNEIISARNESRSQPAPWQRRGFVCGVQWPVFRRVIDGYRLWLDTNSGGAAAIKQRLVFAHNDVSTGTP
jgi:choline kinase